MTPVARDAAQEAILARWLNLDPSDRNRLLNAARARQGVAIPDVPTYAVSRAQVHTIDGVSRTIRQWATATGWSEDTIAVRIKRGDPITQHPSLERCVA